MHFPSRAFEIKVAETSAEKKTFDENVKWFYDQSINPDDYRVEIIQLNDTAYSTIFIINDIGVSGEIFFGSNLEHTQGTNIQVLV